MYKNSHRCQRPHVLLHTVTAPSLTLSDDRSLVFAQTATHTDVMTIIRPVIPKQEQQHAVPASSPVHTYALPSQNTRAVTQGPTLAIGLRNTWVCCNPITTTAILPLAHCGIQGIDCVLSLPPVWQPQFAHVTPAHLAARFFSCCSHMSADMLLL
jgi:hypothetical protein